MNISQRLAQLALDGTPFKVKLYNLGIFKTDYFPPLEDLKPDTIVGHVEMLHDKSSIFVISKIKKVSYKRNQRAPVSVSTEPILHSWDTRKIKDLICPTFHLCLPTIQCILRKQ